MNDNTQRTPIESLTITGFKSIRRCMYLTLNPKLNIFIGANGSGKSNLIDFFRMLRSFTEESFQSFINQSGSADGFFYLGPKQTPKITGSVRFKDNSYSFELEPTAIGAIQFASETPHYKEFGKSLGKGHLESKLKLVRDAKAVDGSGKPGVAHYVYKAVSSWTVYHVHDTSRLAGMRREGPSYDHDILRDDARNLAAFLCKLSKDYSSSYTQIVDAIRLIAPYFDDFVFRPITRGQDELLKLEWTQKGSDFPFQSYHLSDGTIRFIALVTALLQPDETLPSTVLIDEPELGLHPFAISIFAEVVKSACMRTQLLIATQSPQLISNFKPAALVTVNRVDGATVFERQKEEDLAVWLEDYNVGELWQKNVIEGGPTRG